MRSIGRRSVFAATLCAGAAMIGTSVYGIVGIDAELQRSAVAAQERTVDSVRVSAPAFETSRDCPGARDPSSRRDV
jgi:hypothetical protein